MPSIRHCAPEPRLSRTCSERWSSLPHELATRRGAGLLLDSRAEPWSKAERLFHRLLRDTGITGWHANQPVVLGNSRFYVDVLFRRLKLVIEIDGRLYHTGAEVFETDRWRQNLLVLDGWCVLRFTWTMIEERPEEVIAMVREAIEMLTALRA
jgi:very-short-patch-repair endonuclease